METLLLGCKPCATVSLDGLTAMDALRGLAINLPLLIGVASVMELVTPLLSGRGENTFEKRLALDVSFRKESLGTNVLSRLGVLVWCKFGSGRNVAMETLRLGCKACATVSLDGLKAMDTLRGPLVVLAFDPVDTFSLPSNELGRRQDMFDCLLDGTGVREGRKLEIPRSGILLFEGPSGGFFSATVLSVCLGCLAAAIAPLSCFCLVSLSSAS